MCKGKTYGIKNKDGVVVTEDKVYKQAWVEHFKQLLPDTETKESAVIDGEVDE